MRDSNKFHRFLSLLPAWQQAYIQEYKRVHAKDVGLAMCGGGWYAVYFEDDAATLKRRVRKGQVLQLTEELKVQPEFKEVSAAG